MTYNSFTFTQTAEGIEMSMKITEVINRPGFEKVFIDWSGVEVWIEIDNSTGRATDSSFKVGSESFKKLENFISSI